MPVNNWLRDDRMTGLQDLGGTVGIYGNPGELGDFSALQGHSGPYSSFAMISRYQLVV